MFNPLGNKLSIVQKLGRGQGDFFRRQTDYVKNRPWRNYVQGFTNDDEVFCSNEVKQKS